MTRTPQWGAFGVTLAMVLVGPGGGVKATERLSVIVHIDDRVKVPARDLAPARIEVEQVFRAAGIEIEWVEGRVLAPMGGLNAGARHQRHLLVMLVNNTEEQTSGATGCSLGVAAPAIGSAYVFHNRILETGRTRPVDVRVVLGRVIAHELGHLVLPPGSHSNYGIMRADLDLGFVNSGRFTADQVRKLRAGLAIPAARE